MSDYSTGASDLRKSDSTAVTPGKVQTIGDRFGESSLSTENLRSTARSQTETHNRYLDPRYDRTLYKPRSEYSSISSSSRSGGSSRSNTNPLSISSCLQDDRKPETSDAHTSTLSKPRSEYSSTSSSSRSGRSSRSNINPLSFSSCLRDDPKPKNSDARYYSQTFLDLKKPEKKPLSCQMKDRDPRYFTDSSYYR